MEFDKAGVGRFILESVVSICLKKPRYKVYQWSLQHILEFVASFKEALKEFIEKNLNIGFIQPTLSLHGTPVLFIKKKDGSLCLCIKFCGLNYISKKDYYLLLLISNLLNLLYKA